MSKKNRRTGHKAELDWVEILSSRFGISAFRAKRPDGSKVSESEAEVGTTRQFSRNLDGRKIDIWFKPSLWLSKFWFQVKKTTVRGKSNSIDVGSLFEINPPSLGIKALVTRIKRKTAKTERHESWIVSLLPDDFFKLMDLYRIAQEQQVVLDYIQIKNFFEDNEDTKKVMEEIDRLRDKYYKILND